jgi:hypothetical protein
MSIMRRDVLFRIVATVIILIVLAIAAPLRHTTYNPTVFWVGIVGGLVVSRVGLQIMWTGMRSRRRPLIWMGGGVSAVGLYAVYLGLVYLRLLPR